MKTLYLDCGMGAAGDMLSAALYELVDDKEAFLQKVQDLQIPGVEISAHKAEKCGITGTHMEVLVHGMEEAEHEHHHAHHHEDHHHEEHDHHTHHHSSMQDIAHIVEHMPVSEKVKKDVLAVYGLIAEAESAAHGKPVSEIHFHEVGTMDAVADITMVCLLMEKIGADRVLASPVHVGCGQVHCAHGILPVPAPATAYILKNVPIYGGSIAGELCTPTGAALLKYFADSFGDMPVLCVEKIGYGMGKKDFARANCIRALLGTESHDAQKIVEFTCNLDDMTPERIGFAAERLFEAGALDVYTIPVCMKKSRPGQLFCVMCEEEKKDIIRDLIFKHTTTLGIREKVSVRYALRRESEKIKTPFGEVRLKRSEGYGTLREKYEYEDLAAIARNEDLSIEDVLKSIEAGVDM